MQYNIIVDQGEWYLTEIFFIKSKKKYCRLTGSLGLALCFTTKANIIR